MCSRRRGKKDKKENDDVNNFKRRENKQQRHVHFFCPPHIEKSASLSLSVCVCFDDCYTTKENLEFLVHKIIGKLEKKIEKGGGKNSGIIFKPTKKNRLTREVGQRVGTKLIPL